MRLIKDYLILIVILLLASCLPACKTAPKLPELPEAIHHVVEEYRPLPGWATIELPLPPLESTTVQGHLKREKALEAIVEQANCHRKLLRQLDAGRAHDSAACR